MRPLRPRLLLVGYGLAALALPDRGGPVFCPFRLLTGRECPACGLTRATGHALRGNLRASVAAHRLGPVVAVTVLLALAPRRGRDRSQGPDHQKRWDRERWESSVARDG